MSLTSSAKVCFVVRGFEQGVCVLLYIDLPTRAEIIGLTGIRSASCVTIYVSTSPESDAAQSSRIELKNLLKEAVRQLEAVQTSKNSIDAIAEAIQEIEGDDEYWAHQANSLAIFVNPDQVRTYRLPSKLHNQVHVSDRFHIKPLLRAVTFPHDAYVLAISMGAVRLIEVSADLPPHEVKVASLPRDMADAIGRRSHLARSGGMRGAELGSESALLSRYARTVDEALRPVLTGNERPLIVAASEPLSSVYRKVSTYPHTVSIGISGSPDHTPDHTLAEKARTVLDAIYADEIKAIWATFEQRRNQGRATTDMSIAARAATFGAIETLIVDIDEIVEGSVSDDDGTIHLSDTADAVGYGVIDEITCRALRAGARVIAARKTDVPGGSALAAILRYAM